MLVAAALSALCVAAQAQPQPELKPITIVVGSTAGGGYDIYARVLARHMSRHLPGQPSIIVQNMPGASSLKALQYLDVNAPKDGSVKLAPSTVNGWPDFHPAAVRSVASRSVPVPSPVAGPQLAVGLAEIIALPSSASAAQTSSLER